MLTFNDLRGQPAEPGGPTLFDLPPVTRTFDTPEFRGLTFYEVQAKSLLNRVPGASRMPFEWTVNAYRGCSHACSYCLSGDTPILMADGRTKPLAEVRVGDEVYGTERSGAFRRYVTTRVLDHWQTVKPAYRVVLEDGTELIASDDHRFLTDHGWKHVTVGRDTGERRPHLSHHDRLVGPGKFAEQPKSGVDYRRGYLCGLIRGDGLLRSHEHQRPGRTHGNVHQFRLAMTDAEPLDRCRRYLAEFGVSTRGLVFSEPVGVRQRIHAIRNYSRSGVAAIKDIIRWPHAPTGEWRRGFLAGIFDAAGSCRPNGSLRITNTDPEIIYQVISSLRHFGFSLHTHIREQGNAPLTSVWLGGGLGEHLRFFHTTDPSIERKRSIKGVAVRASTTRVTSIAPLGLDLPLYDITTGTGDFIANGVCSHNCFARPTHTYLNFDAGEDFEKRIVVKVNAAEVLRRELRRPTWGGHHVAMGTNTDPYQRCEGRYKLTRSVLEVFRDLRNPCSVLTKSPLLTRDLDVMTELRDVAGFSAALSIGTLDEDAWRSTEPGTPHPRARIDAVRRLREAGIECGVLVAPVLPGISDSPDQLKAVVGAAAEAGATHISAITLHLRPGVKEVFMPWLEREHPELVAGYRRMYRGSNAPKQVRETIGARVRSAKAAAPTRPGTPSSADGTPSQPPAATPGTRRWHPAGRDAGQDGRGRGDGSRDRRGPEASRRPPEPEQLDLGLG